MGKGKDDAGFWFEKTIFGVFVGAWTFTPTEDRNRKRECACSIGFRGRGVTLGLIGIKPYVAIEYDGDVQHWFGATENHW